MSEPVDHLDEKKRAELELVCSIGQAFDEETIVCRADRKADEYYRGGVYKRDSNDEKILHHLKSTERTYTTKEKALEAAEKLAKRAVKLLDMYDKYTHL
jgi:hypothetical protein